VSDPKSERHYRGVSGDTFPAEILFSYPPSETPLPFESIDAFCFPHGVEPKLVERTPSMSGVNDVVYGQRHLTADDKSFVFTLRVGETGEEVRSLSHWFPYDRVRVVNADP
jgi:hypothetical protein